jgi:hypothetical protein
MRVHRFRNVTRSAMVALVCVSGAVSAAWADEERSDDINFGHGVTVEAGETSNRDIVVFGGTATIAGEHHGDVFVFGGGVTISGTQTGDVVVFGGGLDVSGSLKGSTTVFGGGAHLASTAVLDGDVSLLGGTLNREPGSVVHGGHVAITKPRLKGIGPWFGFPGIAGIGLGLSLLGWLKSAVMTLLLGLLIVGLMPAQVEAAGAVLRDRWPACLGWGFVAFVAVIPLSFLLLVTCIGAILPFAFYQVAKYFGFAVLFAVVGEPLARGLLRRDLTLVPAFLVGFVALSLLALVMPIVSVWLVCGWVAVGCTLLTRFGTLRPWFTRRPPRVADTMVAVSATEPQVTAPAPPPEGE